MEKAARRKVKVSVAVLEATTDTGCFSPSFLLVKRPEKGLLAGLWQFPLVELPDNSNEDENPQDAACGHVSQLLQEHYDCGESNICKDLAADKLGCVGHVFSHIDMTIEAHRIRVKVGGRC